LRDDIHQLAEDAGDVEAGEALPQQAARFPLGVDERSPDAIDTTDVE